MVNVSPIGCNGCVGAGERERERVISGLSSMDKIHCQHGKEEMDVTDDVTRSDFTGSDITQLSVSRDWRQRGRTSRGRTPRGGT